MSSMTTFWLRILHSFHLLQVHGHFMVPGRSHRPLFLGLQGALFATFLQRSTLERPGVLAQSSNTSRVAVGLLRHNQSDDTINPSSALEVRSDSSMQGSTESALRAVAADLRANQNLEALVERREVRYQLWIFNDRAHQQRNAAKQMEGTPMWWDAYANSWSGEEPDPRDRHPPVDHDKWDRTQNNADLPAWMVYEMTPDDDRMALPFGWIRFWNHHCCPHIFYFNEFTQESQYNRPTYPAMKARSNLASRVEEQNRIFESLPWNDKEQWEAWETAPKRTKKRKRVSRGVRFYHEIKSGLWSWDPPDPFQSPTARFVPNEWVYLINSKARPDLNGRTGTVYCIKNGRVIVRLKGEDSEAKKNVEIVHRDERGVPIRITRVRLKDETVSILPAYLLTYTDLKNKINRLLQNGDTFQKCFPSGFRFELTDDPSREETYRDNWKGYRRRDGKAYWYNIKTRKVTFEGPTNYYGTPVHEPDGWEPHYDQIAGKYRVYWVNNYNGQISATRPRIVDTALSDWEGPFLHHHKKYWHNRITGESTWDDPHDKVIRTEEQAREAQRAGTLRSGSGRSQSYQRQQASSQGWRSHVVSNQHGQGYSQGIHQQGMQPQAGYQQMMLVGHAGGGGIYSEPAQQHFQPHTIVPESEYQIQLDSERRQLQNLQEHINQQHYEHQYEVASHAGSEVAGIVYVRQPNLNEYDRHFPGVQPGDGCLEGPDQFGDYAIPASHGLFGDQHCASMIGGGVFAPFGLKNITNGYRSFPSYYALSKEARMPGARCPELDRVETEIDIVGKTFRATRMFSSDVEATTHSKKDTTFSRIQNILKWIDRTEEFSKNPRSNHQGAELYKKFQKDRRGSGKELFYIDARRLFQALNYKAPTKVRVKGKDVFKKNNYWTEKSAAKRNEKIKVYLYKAEQTDYATLYPKVIAEHHKQAKKKGRPQTDPQLIEFTWQNMQAFGATMGTHYMLPNEVFVGYPTHVKARPRWIEVAVTDKTQKQENWGLNQQLTMYIPAEVLYNGQWIRLVNKVDDFDWEEYVRDKTFDWYGYGIQLFFYMDGCLDSPEDQGKKKRDNKIEFNEFVCGFRTFDYDTAEDMKIRKLEAKALFSYIDVDKGDTIEFSELREACKSEGIICGQQEVDFNGLFMDQQWKLRSGYLPYTFTSIKAEPMGHGIARGKHLEPLIGEKAPSKEVWDSLQIIRATSDMDKLAEPLWAEDRDSEDCISREQKDPPQKKGKGKLDELAPGWEQGKLPMLNPATNEPAVYWQKTDSIQITWEKPLRKWSCKNPFSSCLVRYPEQVYGKNPRTQMCRCAYVGPRFWNEEWPWSRWSHLHAFNFCDPQKAAKFSNLVAQEELHQFNQQAYMRDYLARMDNWGINYSNYGYYGH